MKALAFFSIIFINFMAGIYSHDAMAQVLPSNDRRSDFTAPTILPLPASDVLPAAVAVPPAAPDPAQKTVDKKPMNKDNDVTATPVEMGEGLNNLFEDKVAENIPDPKEAVNRQILDFNIFLDRAFLKPISTAVGFILPDPVEQIVRNILKNLQEPSKFIFLTMSGHFTDGLLTLSRFTINSTLGVGGAFDPASSFSPALRTKDTSADFMLASWGVPIGDYNVAFFTGPSNQRSSVAGYANSILDPANILLSLFLPSEQTKINWSILGTKAVLNRPPSLDSLADFADPYSVAKSAYWQNYQEREKRYKENK